MSETRFTSGFAQGTKREREENDDSDIEMQLAVQNNSGNTSPTGLNAHLQRFSTPTSSAMHKEDNSPARSSTSSLSEVGTTTPSTTPKSSVRAFAIVEDVASPPKKRAKLTFAEKEEMRILKAVRQQEKAEEAAQKEAERKARADDKARRDAEKEAERKRKDAEKEAERKRKDAERDEKRLAKEAEKAKKSRNEKIRRVRSNAKRQRNRG